MSTTPGFIASVGNDNTTSTTNDFPWFILRATRKRPYDSLHVGAPLYWFDPAKEVVFLQTRLIRVEQLAYRSVDELRPWLAEHYREHGSADPYFVEKAKKCRYCVAFWMRPIQELNLPRPEGCKFERDGWLPCDSEDGRRWLAPLESIELDGRFAEELRATAGELTNAGYFDPVTRRQAGRSHNRLSTAARRYFIRDGPRKATCRTCRSPVTTEHRGTTHEVGTIHHGVI